MKNTAQFYCIRILEEPSYSGDGRVTFKGTDAIKQPFQYTYSFTGFGHMVDVCKNLKIKKGSVVSIPAAEISPFFDTKANAQRLGFTILSIGYYEGSIPEDRLFGYKSKDEKKDSNKSVSSSSQKEVSNTPSAPVSPVASRTPQKISYRNDEIDKVDLDEFRNIMFAIDKERKAAKTG